MIDHPPFRATLLLITVGVLLLSALTGSAQTPQAQLDQYGRWINGVSEPWFFQGVSSKGDISAAQQKWLAIHAENAGTSTEWAGDYFAGSETHGTYLRWSPPNGFVSIHVDKCAAEVMDFSYGNAIVDSNRIQLVPLKAVNLRGNHEHVSAGSLELLPVTWRGRYLVPENEIANFGNYVAGLGKYNDWAGDYIEVVEFFSKLEREVGGTIDQLARPPATKRALLHMDLPELPRGFERFIKKPVDVQVKHVGKAWVRRNADNPWCDDLILPAVINAGKAEGVSSQMKFKIADSGETIIATIVGSHQSRGIVIRATRKRPCVKYSKDDDCAEIDYPPITIGLRASTSPFRYDQ